MSRDSNSGSTHKSARERLEALRKALDAGNVPPGLQQLLEDLAPDQWPDPDNESGDEEMLAILISEALAGVDIARRYPRYFKRLLVDAELRSAFLSGVEVLAGGDEAYESLPLPPNRDLSFLNRAKERRAEGEVDDSGDRVMHWRRSARDLVTAFSFLLPPAPGVLAESAGSYRAGGGFLEDDVVTLMRGRVTSRTMHLDMTLEGLRPADRPHELHLTLWVVAVDDAAYPEQDVSMLATVQWGDYEAQVLITGDGRYSLPPRPIEDVAADAKTAARDLTISLQVKR